MKFRNGAAALVLAAVVACSPSNQVEVVGVLDGDSILIASGEEVRLSHIDAPEPGQAWSEEATQFVKDACLGKKVVVKRHAKRDYYSRTLAEVILPDRRNLNQELVKGGLAWHYRKYSHNRYYQLLEQEAQAKRKGLWGDKDPVAPWDWRHCKK